MTAIVVLSTMDKQNPIHIFLLLLVTLAIASYVSTEHFYIVPNDSTSQCQNYSAGTCFTLAEFASNSSYLEQDNLTLSFLPGQHVLTRRLTIIGSQNIGLTGGNSSNSLSTIKCQGTSGFEFGYIQSLDIEYLEFTGCGNVERGGAIYIHRADNVIIRGCHFTDNHVVGNRSGGGAIYIHRADNVIIRGCHFTDNHVVGNRSGGGAIYIHRADNVLIRDCHFTDNHVSTGTMSSGGAIHIHRADKVLIRGCHFTDNHVIGVGGAICAQNTVALNIEESFLDNNYAYGLYSDGGAIFVSRGVIISTNVYYINNSATDGGAISVYSSNITSTNDHYTNNSAVFGGATSVYSGNITSTNDQYTNNSAYRGGAISVENGNIDSTNDHYTNNSARIGGAISVYSGNITSTNDYYTNNSAGYGGAIFASADDTKLSGANFEHNSAGEGAVIYQNGGALVIGQSNVTENFASSKNTVYMKSGTLSLSGGVNFMNNQGSLYVFNTQVEFKGIVAFVNNFGDSGGAIAAFFSEISFNTASTVTIFNNTATNGGGMSLIQSNLHVYHSIELTDNHATGFGGGIYAYQSNIEFKPEQTQRSEITKNTASNGGAVCAIASNMHISNTYMEVNSNIAKVNGGAIYLEQNSKIYVQKHVPENPGLIQVRLDFISNTAEKGGAIFVADNTNDGVICQGANTEIYQAECFLQTLGLYQSSYSHFNLINTFFSDNTAHQFGSDIYGGLLDRCTINQNAELVHYFPEFRNLSGFQYVKATTQIEQITDYNEIYYSAPDYFIENISRSDVKELISSDAVRVEFCLNNVISPNYSHPNVSIKKGEMFTVSLVAVDQVGNPLNAKIINSFQSESGNGRLKAGQVDQQVGDQCTELEYNVYSQDDSAQIHIYADGPCGDKGVSRKTLNVIFLPCTCPVGFEPSPGPTEIDCICECDQTLRQHRITSCSSESETILVETNTWIGLSNYSNETGFVIHDCVFDYCVEKPVNISLSSPDSADEQCAYNRTGNLCGMCQEDLSLVFGSTHCQECSDNYISLLIHFALVGIALVVFILLLNLTVATGTIHGLIFYANILTANHSLFLPPSTSNFLTVFISWLNLDLGIETCFYDGMDSYGKFLLQLAFPRIYLYLLALL